MFNISCLFLFIVSSVPQLFAEDQKDIQQRHFGAFGFPIYPAPAPMYPVGHHHHHMPPMPVMPDLQGLRDLNDPCNTTGQCRGELTCTKSLEGLGFQCQCPSDSPYYIGNGDCVASVQSTTTAQSASDFGGPCPCMGNLMCMNNFCMCAPGYIYVGSGFCMADTTTASTTTAIINSSSKHLPVFNGVATVAIFIAVSLQVI